MLSEATRNYIARQDAALNKRAGWEKNDLAEYIRVLMAFGDVEIGWRETCGNKIDRTQHVYRAWIKVLLKLKKDGFVITEERVRHSNTWATLAGGFWSSIIYKWENKE